MAANTIDLSAVTGSGWYSVKDTDKVTDKAPASDKIAAQYGNNIFMATAQNTHNVSDTGSGSWTINLSKMTQAGLVTLGGASDVYIGSDKGDSISVAAASVTIKGGAGADSILGTTSEAYVATGAGDDSISLSGNGIQVLAGDGNDIVSISGNDAKINTGASKDSIAGDSVVVGGTGAYVDATSASLAHISVNGADATVKGGKSSFISVVGGANAYIYGGTGDDTVTADSDYANINAGAGANSIVAAGRENVITTGTGKDTISVSGANDTITSGAENDVISLVGAEGALVNAGAGDDSVFVAGKGATITGGAGKDVVSVGSTGAVFSDYTYGTDHIILGNGVGSTNTTSLTLTSDGVASTSGADVQISATSNYYKAQLYAAGNSTVNSSYAWGSDTAATINLASEKNAFYVDAADNEVGDVVTGTKYDDTIVAGTKDTILGGVGSDSISVAADATDVVVTFQTNLTGDDSIVGATYGFDDTALTVQIDGTYTSATVYGSNALKLTGKKGTMTLEGLKATSAANNSADVRILQNGTVTNTQFIAAGQSASIDADAQYLYGVDTTAGITLSGSDTYAIDLSNNKAFADTRTYANIKRVDASASTGDVILVGNGESTLTGGQGNSTLWGFGAKGDLLTGGTGNDTFFYGNGNGRDTITGYSSGDTTDGSNTDTIVFLTEDLDLSKTRKDANGLVYTMGSGTTQKLTVKTTGAEDANTIYNWKAFGDDTTYHSKYGLTSADNSFTYDSSVSLYYGGTGTDTLTFSDTVNGTFWLGQNYDGVMLENVEVFDASMATGDIVLWGENGANSTVIGGQGNTTLFGGFNGSNDVLQGSAFSTGTTTFLFGTNDGKDTITASSATDKVVFYDIDESGLDYTKTKMVGTDLRVVLTDGSTLTVTGIADGVNTFTFNDGNSYTWDTTKTTNGFNPVNA